MISPWDAIGDKKDVSLTTELVSCFKRNPVALRLDVYCNYTTCPLGGVGVYNPGYWGMNIEEGQSYKVIFYVKSSRSLNMMVALTSQHKKQVLAYNRVMSHAKNVKKWTKMEMTLKANASSAISRLELTSNQKGTIWLDQVSVMPNNTYKGHGFRRDLMEMISRLEPRFLRFPGGINVEGNFVSNAFRWKNTIGPWEKRPGQASFWNYWSDDGLGFLEYLQLAEDLGAKPIWVVSCGISIQDEVNTSLIAPFVQDVLDGIEFSRGDAKSKWGSLRAKLGHLHPFNLKYIAIGYQNCQSPVYKGNYLMFYDKIKKAYPDIKIISNCDASKGPLDLPSDLYDINIITKFPSIFQTAQIFEKARRDPRAPKASITHFDSGVKKQDTFDTFKRALAEAAFLLSLEQNSDVVEMVGQATLLANEYVESLFSGAIIFNSNRVYGIANYWCQLFFKESSGAILLKDDYKDRNKPSNVFITAIKWMDLQHNKYIKIKVVNINSLSLELKISFDELEPNITTLQRKSELFYNDLQPDDIDDNLNKVVPVTTLLNETVGRGINLVVKPYSFTSFDMMCD